MIRHILFKRFVVIGAFIGSAFLGAQRTVAQQVETPFPAVQNSEGKVWLIYDEQEIPDRERARVYALLSDTVPKDKWPRILARRGENLWGVVSKYFQFFAKIDPNTKQGYPQTTDALVKEIQRANDIKVPELTEDTELRLPPVPVRGDSFFELPGFHIRTYRPSTQCYESADRLSALTFCDTSRIAPAADLGSERAANFTVVEFDASTLSTERLRSFGEHWPADVFIRSSSRYVQIRLFQQGSGQCGDATDWLSNSPYLPLLKERLSALGDEGKQQLATKAKRMPFVILDWGTESSAQGHGAKVLSVAHYLLHELGLDFVSDLVVGLDLRPGPKSQGELLSVLRNYQTKTKGRLKQDPRSEDFKDAERWIRHPPPLAEGAIDYQVPEILVQALFWKFSNEKSWVNFSFAFYSPALRLIAWQFLTEPNSFAFLAAGNTPVGLTSDTVPQDSGSSRRNLVNVTYGHSQGAIWGSFSDTESNMIVSLVGPGCGFAYESIGAKDQGSSFASPYVGVAAWLKYLLDDVGVYEMRRWLILASRPVASQTHPVESRGVFDAARLLSFPSRAHYIDGQNRLVSLKAYDVTVCIKPGDGESKRLKWKHEGKQTWRTLAVYSDENHQLHVLVREVNRNGFPLVTPQDGLLTCAHLSLIKETGDKVVIKSPSELVAQLSELSF